MQEVCLWHFLLTDVNSVSSKAQTNPDCQYQGNESGMMGWWLAGGAEGSAGHVLGLSFNLNVGQQTEPKAF